MSDRPITTEDLETRARTLAGRTLASLAEELGWEVPASQRRAKGWVGRLVEEHLGVTAGSRAGPDFAELGVELKTLPVDARGLPRESTYVCTLSMQDLDVSWRASRVWAKLARVLWVPVQADRGLPLPARRLGTALLWSPTPRDEATLRRDWEEHVGLARIGELDEITGDRGVYLQVRPKAANRHALGRGVDASGAEMWTLPRGFYLRASFTAEILRRHFVLPG